jgi:hypothetical protein
MHIERSGRFRISLPLAQAMAWVTPEGERRWVSGWEPRYLHPQGTPSLAPHTVFTTDHHDEHSIWIVLRFSAEDGVAEYVRLTPGSRVGVVTVTGTERDGGTDVEVTYRMTSLSADGERALAAMSADGYAAMLREWETLITEAQRR